ncbi:MAG TPA: hypothetical protein VJJ02_00510, partial [Candidatus Paceibacterota bacterium]
IALERKAHAFRKPYLHKGMSFEEKALALRALGYRLETRDMQGNLHFMGKDPVTQDVVRQTVFGDRKEGRGGLHGGLGRGRDDTPDAPALIKTRDGRWISAPTKQKEIVPLSDEERVEKERKHATEKAAKAAAKAAKAAKQAAAQKAAKKNKHGNKK